MPSSSSTTAFLRSVAGRKKPKLSPRDVILGGLWLGPGSGDNGNGHHADLGEDNANAVVHQAIQAGIVEFDTAPWYGAGAAEERLGRALRTVPQDVMEQVKVGTKVGRIFWEPTITTTTTTTTSCNIEDYDTNILRPALAGFDNSDRPPLSARICRNDYSSQGAKQSLEHSLDRLGLEAVDTLRIHDPNDNSNNSSSRPHANYVDEVGQALAPGGMLEELRDMRDRQGIIRHVGLGMNTNLEPHMGAPKEVLRILRDAPQRTFDSALLAGGWNLLCQSGWSCLELCHTSDIQVHMAGIFASGFLADDSKAYAYHHTIPSSLVKNKQQWSKLARKYGYSLQSVAIGFAALPPVVTRLVIGMATPEELHQNLSWLEESNSIPESLWEEAAEQELWSVPTY